MKRTVLVFGLISGALSTAMMLVSVLSIEAIGYGKSEILGYTSIVLSALLVFFGVRSYRESVGEGRITFRRAFGVGLLIVLVSCACYVATWELLYFQLMPGLGDKVLVCMVDRVKASGASQEKIDQMADQARTIKKLWDNPLTNAAITFLEPFPIGLVAALISAAALRKK